MHSICRGPVPSPSARKRDRPMAASSAKRKIDDENRVFQARWEEEYLFTEFKGKPMCLVCLETLSAMKDFNLSRHYNTLHVVKFKKYTAAARAAVVADLKTKVHKQQQLFYRSHNHTGIITQGILCCYN